MYSSGQKRASERPIRVKLGGTILALVRLQNGRQVRAKLHQVSATGGVIHMEKPLDEGIPVEIIFHLCSTTVRCQARALFPLWATQGYLQPFEFQNLAEKERAALQADLDGLIKSSAATVVPPGTPLVETPTETATETSIAAAAETPAEPSIDAPVAEPAETPSESASSAPVS